MLQLGFKELFELKMMQTDPNPANYLYTPSRLNLLDFGSARAYNPRFIDGYMDIVYGAFTDNKDMVMHASHELGFLTGEESREMLKHHYAGA